jgi:predicted HicB family RNase H-like nuclease
MKYKGYEAVITLDEAAGVFSGEVINTRDVITFQGASIQELKQAFEDSVEDYLEFCAERNEAPEKPVSGTLSLRMPPELHREISMEAKRQKKSLNSYIVDRLSAKADRPKSHPVSIRNYASVGIERRSPGHGQLEIPTRTSKAC